MQRALGLGLARPAAAASGRAAQPVARPRHGLRALTCSRYGPRRAAREFREAGDDLRHRDRRAHRPRHDHARRGRARGATRALLEPLRHLGRDHARRHRVSLTRALVALPEDRIGADARALRAVLARVEDPRPIRDLPAEARELMRANAALHLRLARDLSRGSRGAAHRRRCSTRMGAQAVRDVRQPDPRELSRPARRGGAWPTSYRRRVELFAVQAGSGWQAELWSPASAILCYMLTEDLVGLRRVIAQLERLAEDVPSLRPHAQAGARRLSHRCRANAGAYRDRQRASPRSNRAASSAGAGAGGAGARPACARPARAGAAARAARARALRRRRSAGDGA